ncbi:MAG: ribonuclease-3 [Gammaproteobacteria bacterium]
MNVDLFERLTGYPFQQTELLEQALTHRSFSKNCNNERLEFLGDSVLGVVISARIYQKHPKASEGELSRLRASLVKEETLSRIASRFNIGDLINLGGGELKSGGFRRHSILSDTIEALIGAVYLDGGLEASQAVIFRFFEDELQQLPDAESLKDPKTRLQEYLQAKQLDLPEYRLVKTTGKAHDQFFTVTCFLESLNHSASGQGSSRKKAEQNAASEILKKLQI